MSGRPSKPISSDRSLLSYYFIIMRSGGKVRGRAAKRDGRRANTARVAARWGCAWMALIALSDDELRSIFGRLCNALRPFDAMGFGSANHGLWLLTKALREELKEWHASVAALGRKVCPTAQSEWWWRRTLREATRPCGSTPAYRDGLDDAGRLGSCPSARG